MPDCTRVISGSKAAGPVQVLGLPHNFIVLESSSTSGQPTTYTEFTQNIQCTAACARTCLITKAFYLFDVSPVPCQQ